VGLSNNRGIDVIKNGWHIIKKEWYHAIHTEIGEDCPVTVHFDFQPYEKATLEYPGCEAEVTITGVDTTDGVNNYDILDCLSKDCIQDLSERCIGALDD